jgi:hypothetical protein
MTLMVLTTKRLLAVAAVRLLFAGKATHGGGLGIHLPIAAVAAIAGLWLLCGTTQAARYLPATDNPYCDIPTYKLRDVAEQAMSLFDSNGRPVIVINTGTLNEKPSYARFLMAHECCHHTLGHVRRYREGLGHVGPQPFFYIAPQLKQMELQADCCAVRMLKQLHQPDGIEAAQQTMIGFGLEPTGAYYPTGIERADNIAACAATD